MTTAAHNAAGEAFHVQPRLLSLGCGDELGHLPSFEARARHQTVSQRTCRLGKVT